MPYAHKRRNETAMLSQFDTRLRRNEATMLSQLDVPFTMARNLRNLLTVDRGHNVCNAVRAAVRPGDRVLDAGTGTGLLSLVALAAGAAHVVAVDRQHLDVAREIAEVNGVADRITWLDADLTDADLMNAELSELKGRSGFDLLLAFVYMNHPIGDEGRAGLVVSLRDRFCSEGCTFVPAGVRYRAAGCERLDWDLSTELADLDVAEGILRASYGLDFQPLVDRVRREVAAGPTRPIDLANRDWRPNTTMASVTFARRNVRFITGSADFARLDYAADSCSQLPSEVTLDVTTPGRLDGVVWTQELVFQGRPLWTTETFSPAVEPCAVQPGDSVVVQTGDQWRATNTIRVSRSTSP
jgi:SAM-dependent methyltransferase